ERFPTRPDSKVDVLPVIESGAFQLAFVEREAKRTNEVQRRTDREAGAPRVSRVPVNLRMHEHDVRRAHGASTQRTDAAKSAFARSRITRSCFRLNTTTLTLSVPRFDPLQYEPSSPRSAERPLAPISRDPASRAPNPLLPLSTSAW